MNKKYDIIIIGLGAMGSAAARACSLAGRSVLGLERFNPVHNLGSSHGESRVIRQAYFESPGYVPLLLRSYDLWRELEQVSGQSLLRITGGLFMGPPHLEVFAGSLAAARIHNLPHQVLSAGEISKRWSTMRPGAHFQGLLEYQAGVLAVEACVAAMLDQAGENKADLRFNQQVTGWEANGSGVTVFSEKEVFEAGHLILCPGPWAGTLLQTSLPLCVERMVMHWFKPECDSGVLDPRRFPVYFCQVDEHADFYGFPIMDVAMGAKVAFHSFRQSCDPDTIRREVSPGEVEHLAQYLRTYYPDIAGQHLKSTTCMYTSTPDGHFVLGPHPDFSRVTLACGFSGHGFKFAPLVGEITAQLALEGGTDHDIGLFDPRRFTQTDNANPVSKPQG